MFMVLESFVLLATFAIMKIHVCTQFAIQYCCLILCNVYSSKKRVDSEFNSISLKKHDGPWNIIQNISSTPA